MLFLICQSENERYAVPCDRVVEVLPLVPVHRVASPCPALAGVLQYRGVTVPVLDLCLLTSGRPAAARLSTRIILINSVSGAGGEQLLGLMAEQATETARIPDELFQRVERGLPSAATHSGPVAWDSRGVIRRLEPSALAALVSAGLPTLDPGEALAP